MNYETRKESLLRKRCQSADQNGDGEERHWNSTKNNQSSTTCTDNDILRNPSNESLDTESRLELLLQQRISFVIIH